MERAAGRRPLSCDSREEATGSLPGRARRDASLDDAVDWVVRVVRSRAIRRAVRIHEVDRVAILRAVLESRPHVFALGDAVRHLDVRAINATYEPRHPSPVRPR